MDIILKIAVDIFLLALLTESITEILVKSTIFRPIRDKLFSINNRWITELITCGYCFSFWVSLLVTTVFHLMNPIEFKILNFTVIVIITHRLSNIIHGSIDRYFDTRKDIRYNKL